MRKEEEEEEGEEEEGEGEKGEGEEGEKGEGGGEGVLPTHAALPRPWRG